MNGEFRVSLDPQKIAVAMAKNSYSVASLAKVLGKSRPTVNYWINARTLLPRQAGELAKALKCDVEDLI